MVLICNSCANARCNIHFDANNRSFMLHCFNCEKEEVVVVDIGKMINKKEHDLILEKKKIENELKKN